MLCPDCGGELAGVGDPDECRDCGNTVCYSGSCGYCDACLTEADHAHDHDR